MSNYYSIKNKVKINAQKWKNKEIDKLIQLKKDMELSNIDKKIINEYMEKKYKKINALHDAKLLEEPTNKILNKQKDKDIENIIINKYYLTQKGYKSDYIEKYIEQQYKEIEKKYNKQKIDFID
jgi:hypothetical protein